MLRRRAAITRTELVVAIAVAIILMVLLLPAIQKVCEAAGRTERPQLETGRERVEFARLSTAALER